MRRFPHTIIALVVGLVLTAGLALALRGAGQAAQAERYLHVKVDGAEGEAVRVNVPLSLVEKVLPAIDHGDLHHGKVKIHGHADLEGIELRAILDAVRTAPDNEYVTVRDRDCNVRVAKSGGLLLVDIREDEAHKAAKSEGKPAAKSTVKVKVPMSVVEALVSSSHDESELDLVAALRALRTIGDTILVSVEDGPETVRIWVDSHNSSAE